MNTFSAHAGRSICNCRFTALLGFLLAIVLILISSAAHCQLAAPAIVTVASASSTSVTVDWTTVSGASGYTVSYGTTSSATGNTSTSGGLPRTISGLTSGTTYYFMVKATGSGNTYSSVVSATPGVAQLAQPYPQACRAGNGQVTVIAPPISGATYYVVYRGTSTSNISLYAVTSGSSSSCTYVDTGVTNGTTYYYQLAAGDADGLGAQGGSHSATPDVTPLAAPDDLLLQGEGTTETIQWVPVSAAQGGYIYRSTCTRGILAGDPPYDCVENVNQYVDDNVVVGQSYCYGVTAFDADGEGAMSSTYCVTIGNTPVGTPTPTATAATSAITVSWSQVTNGSDTITYCVYKGTATDPTTLCADGLSGLSYVDNSVTNGTTYYYRVAPSPTVCPARLTSSTTTAE
jgi:hypothetical protein